MPPDSGKPAALLLLRQFPYSLKVRVVTEAEVVCTPREDSQWIAAKAAARLSEVIERAQAAPPTIRRNGKPRVVVSSTEELRRKMDRKGTPAEFLLEPPSRSAGLGLKRLRDEPRDLLP